MRATNIPYLTGSADRFERLSRIAAVLRIELCQVNSIAELEKRFLSHETSVLISDAELADGSWRDVLECCHHRLPGMRVVVTARTDSASLWAEVAQAGAVDLIAQPFYAPEVRRCLRTVTEFEEQEQLVEATL